MLVYRLDLNQRWTGRCPESESREIERSKVQSALMVMKNTKKNSQAEIKTSLVFDFEREIDANFVKDWQQDARPVKLDGFD